MSVENPYTNDHSHRSQTSSRIIDCSFRPYRQNLPACIPENEPLSLGNDEFDHWKGTNINNTSEYLFSSPKKHSSNTSQTIKQQSRVYPKTVSRLLASSPAHQNQYRVSRGIEQTTSSTATLTIVSSSVSPCLSPIRYALDRSRNSDNEGVIQMDDGQTNQVSLPTDDSSLKVSRIVRMED
jgi:hypothetical protein